jgi:hypothetical protein
MAEAGKGEADCRAGSLIFVMTNSIMMKMATAASAQLELLHVSIVKQKKLTLACRPWP